MNRQPDLSLNLNLHSGTNTKRDKLLTNGMNRRIEGLKTGLGDAPIT
jgi:hypothetical protein